VPPIAVVLVDGDCGFCMSCVRWAQRWVRPAVSFQPWQSVALADVGLTPQECASAVQWVPIGDGVGTQVTAGGQAVCRTLRAGVGPWPLLGALGMWPGVRTVVDACYRLIAANRHRLPGRSAACATSSPAGR